MERWRGVLKVPLNPNARTCYQVAASLCLSPSSNTLTVPSANVIFFNGDRVAGTRNPVIERLSDLQNIAEILVSKIGGSTNAWVIDASVFNGPFAVYRDFIPSVNQWGEPKSYCPIGYPASGTIISLLSRCLEEVKKDNAIQKEQLQQGISTSHNQTKTLLFGFSKGGTVLNQLVTELGFLDVKSSGGASLMEEKHIGVEEGIHIVPSTKKSLLSSIREIHYVDVGLNSPGAYITDQSVIEKISERLIQGAAAICFILHGTPRQWRDNRRAWISKEKEQLVHLLESEAQRSGGKLQVCEKFYFADRTPNLQMHFEIIEKLDLS
ncbi:hypothetical protein FF1_040393 [Malus domestica]|uniref:Uncharacterized protein n=1 Tax=Malus baccata TaxID=106549 RepID=A0A540MQX2_MALBA|nr:uncharacterized protein LOC126628726 isoform X1 [Malus sylvestris]TQE01172.1 hypothetical protein C1H46_013195 [Malus baccata]